MTTTRSYWMDGRRLAPSLQRQFEAFEQHAGQAGTARRALAVRRIIEQYFRFRRQCLQLAAQYLIQAVVEAHRLDRRDDFAAFDPERREPRHARHAAIHVVRQVHVPEVAA